MLQKGRQVRDASIVDQQINVTNVTKRSRRGLEVAEIAGEPGNVAVLNHKSTGSGVLRQ